MAQGSDGRDHNPYGFTMWLAGGGIKGGTVHGATDEFGYHAVEGKVEVLELAPPAVQTELTPGQATREGYQPLEAFVDEVMALFGRHPTPPEILVERVGTLRSAEAEHRFDQTLKTLNDPARHARETAP